MLQFVTITDWFENGENVVALYKLYHNPVFQTALGVVISQSPMTSDPLPTVGASEIDVARAMGKEEGFRKFLTVLCSLTEAPISHLPLVETYPDPESLDEKPEPTRRARPKKRT